jgi:hypothetical protein
VLKFQVLRLVELRMPRTGGTPRIVPYGADQTVYLVIDRFSGLGSVYRETEAERLISKPSLPISCRGNSTTRSALSPLTRLSTGRTNRHPVVSSDHAACRNRRYALVARAPHRRRRK